MKIIYVHTEPWVSNSPGVTFITYNAVGIAENDVETHLIVLNRSEETTDVLLRQVFDTACPPQLTIHRLEAASHWPFYRRAIALIERLCDDQTTIITRAITFLPHLLWLRRTQRCRILYESHDFYWDLRRRPDVKKHKRRKQSWHERVCLPRIDGLICLQRPQMELYRQYLGPGVPIVVLKTGIHRIQASAVTDRRNVLAYIGSLDLHKGLENLVQLAGALDADTTIEIFGGRTEHAVARLRQVLAQQGVADTIRVSGWLTKPELSRRLAEAKWGLIPLHPTFFNTYLTSPLKLFDFYAHGIPVLASDLPTLRELIEHGKTGFLVDWADVGRIAAMLRIPNQDYRAMVHHITHITAQPLLWQQRGARLLEFIARLP